MNHPNGGIAGLKFILVVLSCICILGLPKSVATAAPTIPPYLYISTEAGGGNNQTIRTEVDLQDDEWRADAITAGATSFVMMDFGTESDDGFGDLRPDTPGPYPNPSTNPMDIPDGTYFDFPTTSGLIVTVSLLNMDGAGPFGGSSAGMTNTYPRLARSATLQDNAPRPQSMYTTSSATRPRFWNEAIGSQQNRNAILFQFSEPIAAFGAWFGDLETRTDGGGTPARVQLFDENNSIIEDQIIPTSTADQSLCGAPVNDDYAGCGNETTRWIGFIDNNVNVSAMLIIVGDDDTTGDDQGLGESISFIGATLAEGITAPEPEPEPEPEGKPEELPETGFTPGKYTFRKDKNKNNFSEEKDISLTIPSLDISTAIVGVPYTNEGWDVEWLGNQVGYLEGTSFPTYIGNTVLTGHVFNHLGLPGIFAKLNNLVYGDQIVINAWGQDHIYEIRETFIASPDDITVLEESGDGFDWLTIITCKGYDESTDAYEWRFVVKAVLVGIQAQ